ncbi:Sperm-tail PG-rich repeat-containing protein 2 [Chytridiales sp. JEL 0842]|nr:Sperm-tail PG-rich repeat-containing protein 2 [Chytridiales sp. JEL 0842]
MYSRAPRKFLTPDQDHANPNLGPGCYTADEPTLIAGKALGEEGYAPFSSLAPRVSIFDETSHPGPAPGAYNPPPQASFSFSQSSTHGAALFGKSRAPRFKKIVHKTPGPGAYAVPETIGRKENKRNHVDGGLGFSSKEHPLTKQPVLALSGSATSLKPRSATPTKNNSDSTKKIDVGNSDGDLDRHLLSEAARGALTSRSLKKRVSVKKAESMEGRFIVSAGKRAKIVWKRKFVPPSIPVGNSAFGYQENEVGELVPRKPPKRNSDPGPAYNHVSSFVEKAKRENHGYRFAKDAKGLKFKVTDSPGPCVYDVAAAEKFLKSHQETGNGPAVMTLAPCTRMTDALVADAVKKGVPGPGAYQTPPPNPNPPRLPPRRPPPAFNCSTSHTTPAPSALTTTLAPGPGSYYPELSQPRKPSTLKPQPFGSTTHRFSAATHPSTLSAPAPGSYDLDSIDSLVSRVEKKVRGAQWGRQKAFGSVGERFKYNPVSRDPGPGAYEVIAMPPPPPGRQKLKSGSRRESGMMRMDVNGRVMTAEESSESIAGGGGSRTVRKPTFKKGNSLNPEDPTLIRVPAFGRQTPRFPTGVENGDLPPPGAYEIAEAFDTLKRKGRLEKTSVLASKMERELFPVLPKNPGPGEYDVLIPDHKPRHQTQGAFLSSEHRFHEKREKIPGPGYYLSPEYENSLIKKSFNISLGNPALVV